MRSFGFWVFLLLVGAALVCLITTITSSLPDTDFNLHKKDMTLTATSRKVKILGYSSKMSDDHYNLEDYGRNDPVPSSKANIRHGTILRHGSPKIPYAPKPSPPAPPAPPAPDRAKSDGLP
ncbi:hypothetical protein POM88_011410 [Heracleum sosnowskyi]|uniref:Uncharacterized protein n=1 Tax=Heracleum sosnowskyi TaxID=360622 RepID=A0AAD8IW75_9APIA|nr:hypothetical protein POM88_011410 [Heracleum sosnowskyi]